MSGNGGTTWEPCYRSSGQRCDEKEILESKNNQQQKIEAIEFDGEVSVSYTEKIIKDWRIFNDIWITMEIFQEYLKNEYQ